MTHIVVTGAAGFIGANLVRALNARGERDIIAVDNLTRGDKVANLADLDIREFVDKRDFLREVERDNFPRYVRIVFHQGACSDTMEQDGRYMMENNYDYSVKLLRACAYHGVRFIYASSASVYGGGTVFKEERKHEAPLNVYGYSKFLFDQFVRRDSTAKPKQCAGFRYFNVYGPREQHKGRMASVAFHFYNQYLQNGKVKLFEGSAGYAAGEQLRDFISVEDVVKVNLFFLEHPEVSGIFNVGTGKAESFNAMARATINAVRGTRGEKPLTLEELRSAGAIEYIPFPPQLVGKYQSYTQADLANLRGVGYGESFLSVEEGVRRYVEARKAAAV